MRLDVNSLEAQGPTNELVGAGKALHERGGRDEKSSGTLAVDDDVNDNKSSGTLAGDMEVNDVSRSRRIKSSRRWPSTAMSMNESPAGRWPLTTMSTIVGQNRCRR